jgi:hypothetical protein
MIIFLLTVCFCLIVLVVVLLLYVAYTVGKLEDTQEVMYDMAVDLEHRNREIELNQEAIFNAYSRQN